MVLCNIYIRVHAHNMNLVGAKFRGVVPSEEIFVVINQEDSNVEGAMLNLVLLTLAAAKQLLYHFKTDKSTTSVYVLYINY